MALHDAFPIFHTADLARAVAFYTERLGFELRYRFDEAEEGSFVALTLGEFSLGLTEVRELEPAGRVALWFYSDDVDGEIAALRQAGVEVAREPFDTEWGERMGSVWDPDRNELFIGQRS